MKAFLYFISTISLYIYIFAPPFRFLLIGTDKFIFFAAIIYITYKREWINLFTIFRKEYILLFCIFIYSISRSLLSQNMDYIRNDLLLFAEMITCAYFLYIVIDKKYKIRLDAIMINCSIIASLISVFLFFKPDIALYLKTNLLKYPENIIDNFYFRGYGFSDGLFFAYPVVVGFCAGFIIMGICCKKKATLYLFPLLAAILFNARSGIVPFGIGIILAIFYNLRFFVKNMLLFSFIFMLLSGIGITIYNNNDMLQTSYNWNMQTFEIFGNLFGGKNIMDNNNLNILFNDMMIFPQTELEWIFGYGERLFNNNHTNETDIGYLLRLNFGGIIYSSLFFLLLICMFFRLIKTNKYIAYLLFLSLIYLNFKGDFFVANVASRFFFFVYTVCLLNNNYFKLKSHATQNISYNSCS